MEKSNFLTKKRFEELNLPPVVMNGLKDAGFTHCTSIQAETLPLSLKGIDVAGQAKTGTGKTATFLVTIFARLLSLAPEKSKGISAIIVAPTRELALQICKEAEILGRHTSFTITSIVGGMDYKKQIDRINKGTDIIVCTPGRIIDYIKQGIVKTNSIKIVVVDEADRLFDLGFAKDMRFILQKLPKFDKRQSMLFSATLSYEVLELTYEYMNLPEFISVAAGEVDLDGIEQTLFHAGNHEKLQLFLGLLEREKWERLLIFCNTRFAVKWLSLKLQGNGYHVEGIAGDLPQRKRLQIMERFKKGQINILIATDVASRGIHVEDISHVINYDLPQDTESYIHRIGRTARAGKTGKALSLACEKYILHLEPLEKMLGYKIPVIWPEDDWFKEDKCGPLPEIRVRQNNNLKRLRRKRSGKSKFNNAKPFIKKAKNSFPGSFFGFSPESPQ